MNRRGPSIATKLTLDLAMLVLFLFCMGFRLTVETTHEWAGIVLIVLFATHIWLNWSWCRTLFKGTYTFRRIINTTVNLSLLGLMALLLFGGLMNAHLLKFLELKGGMQYREWHTFAAYWGLVLVGVHAGLHWAIITGVMRKKTGKAFSREAFVIPLRLVGLALIAFGVWASFDREMGSKLFLGFGFDYWDTERPAALFYLSTFSVVCLFGFIAHWSMRLAASVSRLFAGAIEPVSEKNIY